MDVGSELKDAQLEVKENDRTSDPAIFGKIEFSKESDCAIIQLANRIQKIEDGFVGEYKYSDLTEAELQGEYGTKWILADGRDVTGSKYAEITGRNNVPDARGLFFRGKNNGRSDGNENPAGEQDLGSYEDDTTRRPRNSNFSTDPSGSHYHVQGQVAGGAGRYGTTNTGINGQFYDTGGGISGTNGQNTSSAGNHTHFVTGGGDAETRPKSLTVNIFIKIN